MKKRFISVIRNPEKILLKLLFRVSHQLDDERYLKLLFRLKLGYKLDLDNPITFNQKLQWLKIHYRNPEMMKMADKYEAKKYISNLIGDEYVVKNYGVYNSFEEIDFNELPQQFVLKTTHDQGGIVVCEDKNNFDFFNAKEKLNKHLKRKNFFYLGREWQYKAIKPRIIAEEFLFDPVNYLPNDYKFFCFNGIPRIIEIVTERSSNLKLNYLDINFNPIDLKREGYEPSRNVDKPKNFDKMKEISRILSEGFPHLRVDFYNISGKIYLGELTFYDGGGTTKLEPIRWDYIMGDWIDLTSIDKKQLKNA